MREKLEAYAKHFDGFEWDDDFNIILKKGNEKVRFEIINESVVRIVAKKNPQRYAKKFLSEQVTPIIVFSFDFKDKQWETNHKETDELLTYMFQKEELTYNYQDGTLTWYIPSDVLKERYIDFLIKFSETPIICLLDRNTREKTGYIQKKEDVDIILQKINEKELIQKQLLVEISKVAKRYDSNSSLERLMQDYTLYFLGKFYRISIKNMELQSYPDWVIHFSKHVFVTPNEDEVLAIFKNEIERIYQKEKMRYVLNQK